MSENTFTPFCSTEIVFTNPLELQETILSHVASKNVILVMTHSGESRWNLSSFVGEIEELADSLIQISSVPSNPTQNDIALALETIRREGIRASADLILAIGGGSCIDLAKGISAFYSLIYDPQCGSSLPSRILQMMKNKSYTSCNGIDIIAVPTTSGTGSEVTQWATIWDMVNKEKYSIDCPQLKPKAAYLVPEFTVSLSKELTLSTGLDALSHAMEAYWSKFTTPLVQDVAYRAIELVVHNLKAVLESPSDVALRKRMARASLLAGIAFSKTRTTACHAISYPLTMLYNIPHGFAVALTLARVAEFNRGHFPNDDELYGVFSEYGGIDAWIDFVCEGVVLLRADAFGVKDIERVSKMACGNGRMGNNPVEIDVVDVEILLK